MYIDIISTIIPLAAFKAEKPEAVIAQLASDATSIEHGDSVFVTVHGVTAPTMAHRVRQCDTAVEVQTAAVAKIDRLRRQASHKCNYALAAKYETQLVTEKKQLTQAKRRRTLLFKSAEYAEYQVAIEVYMAYFGPTAKPADEGKILSVYVEDPEPDYYDYRSDGDTCYNCGS